MPRLYRPSSPTPARDEQTPLDYAKAASAKASNPKRKQCNKGYSCGTSCISKAFNCLNPLKGQGKNYAQYLQKHAAVPPAPVAPAAPAPPNPPTLRQVSGNTYQVSVKDSNGVTQTLALDSSRFGNQPYVNLGHLNADYEVVGLARGLTPNINNIVRLDDPPEEMLKPERMNAVLSSVCKDGDVIYLPASASSLSDSSQQARADLDLSAFTPVGVETRQGRYVWGGGFLGKMENGRVVPITDEDRTRAEIGEKARTARWVQVDAVDEEFSSTYNSPNLARIYRNEDEAARDAEPLEDEWLGRKPQPGAVPDLPYWENRASQWARQQGFSDDGVNGFTAAQTKAHDVAHPITHEMTGMNSQQLWQRFGAIKGADGNPSLLGEEAIVNVVEHLSRGDSLEASIVNGLRLTRVLSRGQDSTDEARTLVRSKEFKDTLTELAEKVYLNNNYNDYMAHVRTTNRISKTVAQRGDDFTNTASGG